MVGHWRLIDTKAVTEISSLFMQDIVSTSCIL